MRIEFRVLGTLQVLQDGSVLNLRKAQKPRLLLAILVAYRGQVISVDALVDALWEGNPPKSARKNLLQYVYQLRHAIGRSAVSTEPAGYCIAQDCDTDAATFLHTAHLGGRLLERRDYARALQLLWRGLELWRGDAFSEFSDSEMIRPVISSLEQARTTALEQWVEAKIHTGKAGEVPPVLTNHIQRDPLNENLRAHMMRALALTGRQAEALRLYRETRALLVEQLGIEPGAAIRATHDMILRGDHQMLATRLERGRGGADVMSHRPFVAGLA